MQSSRPSKDARALAARVAELGAGARDLVRLHLGVLDQVTGGAMRADERAIANDARLVLVELLGSVLDLYRSSSSQPRPEGGG